MTKAEHIRPVTWQSRILQHAAGEHRTVAQTSIDHSADLYKGRGNPADRGSPCQPYARQGHRRAKSITRDPALCLDGFALSSRAVLLS